MGTSRRCSRAFLALAIAGMVLAVAPSASAFEFEEPLSPGDTGVAVRALQVRVAGWFDQGPKTQFLIDGDFGEQTRAAVLAFQEFYGLKPTGKVDAGVIEILDGLEDKDHSTAHFDWIEFAQNESSSCSAQANAYAGTFAGGKVSPGKVKNNVRRLMWRLEAIRAKSGDHSIGINSGFRSTAYNDCIGGARASQHLYGTAADNRVAKIKNQAARKLAKKSQVEGIGCYADLAHNHFDLRTENDDLSSSQSWWWPEKDTEGHDLDENGVPCWGEGSNKASGSDTGSPLGIVAQILRQIPGIGSLIPSDDEIRAFERAGEVIDLGGGD